MKIEVSRRGLQFAVAHGRFERAHDGGADGGDAAAARRVSRTCSTSAAPTFNHSLCMRCSDQFIHPHRLEDAGAHVQRDVAERDALGAQRRQQCFVEMQAGGGRGMPPVSRANTVW